jgi:hypothetical protein
MSDDCPINAPPVGCCAHGKTSTRQRAGRLRWSTALAMLAVSLGTGCSASSRPLAVAAPPKLSERVAELCAGVPQDERERPYFFTAAGIEAIRELTGEQRHAKFAPLELRGAEIAVRTESEKGTRHKVARLLRCHMVWREAVGFVAASSFDDPLMVGTPEVSFDETASGLVIRIAGHDRAEGEEILRRAETLRAAVSRD